MSTSDVNADFLLTSRQNIFEQLTDMVDFFKAQTSKTSAKRLKARFSFLEQLQADYKALESQILLFNSKQSDPKAKLQYRQQRVAVDEVVMTIHELFDELMDSTTQQETSAIQCKLPKINIPRFSGGFKEWHSFKELFMSLVHNSALPNIEKFQRLKGSLDGDALQLIAHFTLSNENYSLAWQTLLERYDNPRLAANFYLNSLLGYKLTNSDSPAALQNYLMHHLDTIKAFKALNLSDHFDYVLFQICYNHLDKKTQKGFDVKFPVDCFPKYDDLMNFVQNQLRTLEMHSMDNDSGKMSRNYVKHSFNIIKGSNVNEENTSLSPCVVCSKHHYLYQCSQFANLPINEKYDMLKKNFLCFNCFKKHQRNCCNSFKRCKKCKQNHHTLLHLDKRGTGEIRPSIPDETSALSHTMTCSQNIDRFESKSVLLGTVQGYVRDCYNKCPFAVRILLDLGSQVSCISERLVKVLRAQITPRTIHVKGVSGTVARSSGVTRCKIFTSPKCDEGLDIDLLVLPVISANLPKIEIPPSIRQNFRNFKLADPGFDRAGQVDILIGADKYYDVVSDGKILKGNPNGIQTIFGLVLVGPVSSVESTNINHAFLLTKEQLEQSLTRFWESEEVKDVTPPEVDQCEKLFQETTTRTPAGRYVVALPFIVKDPKQTLGDNRENARQRLFGMESRFNKFPNLKNEYFAFMNEYLELEHMTLTKLPSQYVIPHHAVFKESTTTKLRVVFDASNLSNNGVSLNQLLRKGPKLQQDIFITLSGFRKYKIALVADIKMMYRQILVRPEDRVYQHIFWRTSSDETPLEFELNTVTYGLACSPYLAQRVVKQLIADEGDAYPLAARALSQQIYVDDIVSGGETKEEALQLHSELLALLGKGGFFPRKWSSSSVEVLANIPSEHKETPLNLEADNDPIFKVLGLRWDPKIDAFIYKIKNFEGQATKRTVLSYIARMFDPLGWLTPFVFLCKYFMQLLWLEGTGWDTPLPPKLQQLWAKLTNEVQDLTQIQVHRHIPLKEAQEIIIIGFCDASERGYAAALYIRCMIQNLVTVQLLAAKSKVAPLKPLSIPRLELNAAFLLSKLFKSFESFFHRLPKHSVVLYSDSQVVLGWLRTPPHKLKTYVCNRVVEILNRTPPHVWYHVKSEHNATDCASRGLTPKELVDHPLWWNGPPFVHEIPFKTGENVVEIGNLPELKPETKLIVTTIKVESNSIILKLEKYSSLTKLTRIFAYMLRFTTRTRRLESHTGPLKVSELKAAVNKYVGLVQHQYFAKELELLTKNLEVSSFRALSPFLDQNGLLRVGGRIARAALPYENRHPLLIPARSVLAGLIVKHHHQITLHGGPQTTRSSIQRQFWIPQIGRVIRSLIHKCVTCRRLNPKPITPLMSELPPTRFEQVRPFLRSGVDFAGPFEVKETQRRKAPRFKSYICLFVCFSTKAVHLEVVTGLSTDAFLAAVARFVARRGLCSYLHSDNGTNFVGAARTLSEVEGFLATNGVKLEEELAERHIQWTFNPPSAPHFGGLWEAAVKACKYHLKRVMGSHIFTLEEFQTMCCRIEAVLNSRPLCPLSDNPLDAELVLTPGHFLIGSPLLAIPEIPLTGESINRLTRWQLISQNIQSFWKKWSGAYLQQLIPRKKWNVPVEPLKIGDVVSIKRLNTSPLDWPIARVEELIKGQDEVVRVVKVRSGGRILTRPVSALAKLF